MKSLKFEELVEMIRIVNEIAHRIPGICILDPPKELILKVRDTMYKLCDTLKIKRYTADSWGWFRVKAILITKLIALFRDRISLVYLVNPLTNDYVNKRMRLFKTIMKLYPFDENYTSCSDPTECKEIYYYDLLEITTFVGDKKYIFHALPWEVKWEKVDDIRDRDYWYDPSHTPDSFKELNDLLDKLNELISL